MKFFSLIKSVVPVVVMVVASGGCSFLSDASHAVGDFSHGIGDAFENEAGRRKGDKPKYDMKGNARRSYNYTTSHNVVVSKKVKDAQHRLQSLGYQPGGADGIMGGKTRRAIMSFQRDNGLSATGKLDDVTLRTL